MSIVIRTEFGSRWSKIGVSNTIERNQKMLIMTLRKPTEVASPIYGQETSTTSSHITPKIDKLQKPFKMTEKYSIPVNLQIIAKYTQEPAILFKIPVFTYLEQLKLRLQLTLFCMELSLRLLVLLVNSFLSRRSNIIGRQGYHLSRTKPQDKMLTRK